MLRPLFYSGAMLALLCISPAPAAAITRTPIADDLQVIDPGSDDFSGNDSKLTVAEYASIQINNDLFGRGVTSFPNGVVSFLSGGNPSNAAVIDDFFRRGELSQDEIDFINGIPSNGGNQQVALEDALARSIEAGLTFGFGPDSRDQPFSKSYEELSGQPWPLDEFPIKAEPVPFSPSGWMAFTGLGVFGAFKYWRKRSAQ